MADDIGQPVKLVPIHDCRETLAALDKAREPQRKALEEINRQRYSIIASLPCCDDCPVWDRPDGSKCERWEACEQELLEDIATMEKEARDG